MNKSDTIGKLAAALSKAQAELRPAEMNSANPFLKSKFADLGSVIEAIRPTLAKYELSFSQFPVNDGERIGLETILIHSSGEWLSDAVFLPMGEEKGKSLAQVAGSVITYLRRYALSAVFGVYADEDTDGAQAARQVQPAQNKPQAAPEQWTRNVDEWEKFKMVAVEFSMNIEDVKEILQVNSMHDYKGTRQQAEQEIRKAAAIPKVNIGKGIPAMTK
jgi:hypothetical protein